MIAFACGVTELTTMISRESGKCGVGVELVVGTIVRLAVGVLLAVRVGVTGAGVELETGVGSRWMEKSGFQERNVKNRTPIKRIDAPVIHQPARTRCRR